MSVLNVWFREGVEHGWMGKGFLNKDLARAACLSIDKKTPTG